MKPVRFGESEFEIIVIRKKIRHTYLRIRGNQLVITTNPYTKEADLLAFILKNESKIVNIKHHKYKLYDVTKSVISLFNQEYSIQYIESLRSSYEIDNHDIKVFYRNEANKFKLLQTITADFVIHEALVFLEKNRVAFERNLNLSGILIKAQLMKSQFGSCHTLKKVIKLNSALAMFNPIYLHAILSHELVHLKIKGHQKNFYQLLEMYVPDYHQIRKELKNEFLKFEV